MIQWGRTLRPRISTKLIKKELERNLHQPKSGQVLEYPDTFEKKVMLLNDPRTIQVLEIQ